MLIDRIHKTVRFLANTDRIGEVTREKTDLAIHNAVLELQEQALFDVNRLANRQNRGLVNSGLENITDKTREKILHYLQDSETITVTDGKFTIPDEVRYFDQAFYNNEFIEFSKNSREFNTIKSIATIQYPIGIIKSETVEIAPKDITEITISYLRNPLYAKWTYNIIDGVETFNASKSDFQDVDIHPSEETNLILLVLQKFGINLKENELQSITTRLKQEEFQKENTN